MATRAPDHSDKASRRSPRDTDLEDIVQVLVDALQATVSRWRRRVRAGHLGRHSTTAVTRLIARIDAALAALRAGTGVEEVPAEPPRGDERFRLLVDSIDEYAIFMLDPLGRIESWNAGAERIKGYTVDEILGRSFELFYTPDDRAEGKPARELAEAARVGRYEEEGTRVRKDGTLFRASVVLTALRDPEGNLVGYGKVTRDISDRVRAEATLRQSEERYRRLVEQVTEYAIFLMSPEGRVLNWNQGAMRIKGYTAEEAIGLTYERFFTPEDRLAGKPAQLLARARSEGVTHDQGWRVRKNGERFFADVTITAVHDATGKLFGFTKVVRDLTDQRELLASRQQLAQREEELRIRDEFLAMASHELRTPLSTIVLQAGALRRLVAQTPLEPSKVRKRSRSLVVGVERLSRLVEQLLDLSLLAGGRLELHPESADLTLIVSDVVECLSSDAEVSGSVVTQSAPGPVFGSWDRKRLGSVVWNLLTNALVHAAGAPVEVEIAEHGDEVSLVVRDHGPGMSDDTLARAFDRFGRVDGPPHHRGLGLGLYLSRELVNAHGGRVEVRTSPGEGATFCVILPRHAPASQIDAPESIR